VCWNWGGLRMGIQVRLQGEPSACVHEGRMCVSVLRICREKSGSLRDRMALERSALPRPLIATLCHYCRIPHNRTQYDPTYRTPVLNRALGRVGSASFGDGATWCRCQATLVSLRSGQRVYLVRTYSTDRNNDPTRKPTYPIMPSLCLGVL